MNRHGVEAPRDFKSLVSANSTTPANKIYYTLQTLVSQGICPKILMNFQFFWKDMELLFPRSCS